MRKAVVVVGAILWVAVLAGQIAYAQAEGESKQPPELEAVLKRVEAEGRPDKISLRTASLLGLDSKEPILAKTLIRKPGRGASTFSSGGKVWVTFQVTKNEAGEVVKIEDFQFFYAYLTQTDGILRGALVARKGQGIRTIPLAEAAEDFAAQKVFWKEYVSQTSKP